MAEVAYRYADFLFMTSDNPRSEEPAQILEQMRKGLPQGYDPANVIVETDRDQAIRQAVVQSRPGDIILVAGKGHETYQEIQGKRYPFSDQERLQYWMDCLLNASKSINS